jgi:dTDP-4-amino-4,6-dideoxygalactose transaminase
MNIPFSPPYVDQSVIDEVISSLNSGWITTGPKVKELEDRIKEFTEVPNVLCVNSWTSGAILILKWLGIKEGDEVIIPAYTYSATALAVLHAGGKPVMVDVEDDFNISVSEIRKAITSKTKAILPVDIAGWPCDYKSIMELVTEDAIRQIFTADSVVQKKLNRILVIADAAHSFGSKSEQKSPATFADICIFSLHAVKNLTTAEGGAICINMPQQFNNDELYKYLRMMTLNGQTKDAFTKTKAGGWRYDIVMQGMKINMPDICAAIGLAQIKKYDYLLSERKRVFERYSNAFSKCKWALLPPQDTSDKQSSYHLYALRIKSITEHQRDKIIEEITTYGVAVNVHFIPMPMLSLFKDIGYSIDNFPISYKNYCGEISLPIYPQLTIEQVDYVINSVISSVNKIVS